MTLDDGTPEEMGDQVELTYLDFLLACIVYSLQREGYVEFTLTDIAHIMNGGENARACGELKELIYDRLEICSHIRIKIDCTEEFKEKRAKRKGLYGSERWMKEDNCIIDSRFLGIQGIEEKIKGDRVVQKKYRISDTPAFQEYSQIVEQMTAVPLEFLHGTHGKKFSRDSLFIRFFVMKAIRVLNNENNNMYYKKIMLEPYNGRNIVGAFQKLGYSKEKYPSWNLKRPSLVKFFEDSLDDLADLGEISGYDRIKHRRAVVGFDIKVRDKSQSEKLI